MSTEQIQIDRMRREGWVAIPMMRHVGITRDSDSQAIISIKDDHFSDRRREWQAWLSYEQEKEWSIKT